LSKIYTEIGKFNVAEEFLLGAFSRMQSKDPQAFTIRLKLAQLYLKGFHPERGIRLLRILLGQSPPKAKKEQILIALAKVCHAYLSRSLARALFVCLCRLTH
jgi:predicted Zn-dependent protease